MSPAANPLAGLDSLPYGIVDKDDKPVGNDILKKRPLLLIYTGRLWSAIGDKSSMADDQNLFFRNLNALLASQAGKGLTVVSVMHSPAALPKENRALVGITWPAVIKK